MVMNISETDLVWLLLHLLTEFMSQPPKLFTFAWAALLLDLPVRVRLKPLKICHPLSQKLFTFSTVQIRWTTKVWPVFSKDSPLQVPGVASTSSTDWYQRCCPFVQSSSNLSLTPSRVSVLASRLRVMKWILIQLVVLSLR